MPTITQDINQILRNHRICTVISDRDITVTDKTVSDLVKPTAVLSDAITNHLWPSVNSATVYHYTSKHAAESICQTGIFRFSSIEKRYADGEIETFCKTHNLQGYLDLDKNGEPKYKYLIMPNTYYASFTGTDLTPEQERYFWGCFGSNDGVRLKIKIIASNPNLRKIAYEHTPNTPIKLISELVTTLQRKHNREFILKGFSRLCSFYLSGKDYGIENELRALYRIWEGFGPQPVGTGKNSYIELPLGAMSDCGYKLDIVEVQSRE